MKVVFRLSLLDFGGTERVFLSIADHLSQVHGWRVSFVVDRHTHHATESVARAKGYAVESLEVRRTWQAIWPLARYLRRTRPDVVISAYTETNGAAILSRCLSRTRPTLIVTEHAPLDEHWRDKRWLRRATLEGTVRGLYRLSDLVLCVSRGMAEGLRRRLPGHDVGYVYNPIRFAQRRLRREAAVAELGLPAETRVLLAVGRISRPKNYAMLLRAFAQVRTAGAMLFIVGGVFDEAEKSLLDGLVHEHQLQDRIRFVPFTDAIHRYYEAADALVLSSAWEGFGNVLVEALAFGLPVVSTRCNHGPAEILEDGRHGLLVEVDDVPAMATAIEQVLEASPFDPVQQVQRAQDFAEARIGEQYHDLICRLVGEKK